MSSRSFLSMIARALIRTCKGVRDIHGQATAKVYTKEPDVSVLDIGMFKELHATLGNSTDRVRDVYAKFLDSAAMRVDELRHQPLAASLKTLHALKGSAAMVGASRLAILAARLQETIADGEPLAVGIHDIERELAAFHGALNAQLDSVSGAR
jgi:HPt (histidine-containing phosphotransfer) domain-containing protein